MDDTMSRIQRLYQTIIASAGALDQTPPDFGENRKPKKFDQFAPEKMAI
jgi:hypothetical protein